MRKRFLAILLSLGMALSMAAPSFAAEGVPGWAAKAYETLESRSVLPKLNTSGDITRGDFARLLVGLLDSAVPQSELSAYPAKGANYFHDSYYDPAVLRAAAYGIMEGSAEGDGLRYANAYNPLTREEAATMVCSLLDFYSRKLGHTATPSSTPVSYADAASISSWAVPFTRTIASYRLMVGDEASRFNPQSRLTWPEAVSLAKSTLDLLDAGMGTSSWTKAPAALALRSQVNWSGAARFGAGDYSVSRPKTGYAAGYYTISNGDGTVSGLVVGSDAVTVERFDAGGNLVSTKTLAKELPIFGTFFDSGTHFYLAFGQMNSGKDNSQEVFRVVQYDREWNRLGSVSVDGKSSYTTEPFRSTVSRMAVSGDGKTVTLYAARTRYDGHQSNITISMNTSPFSVQRVMGEQFPSNHVSHSFGQFVQYDGSRMVTVDHGDAYPRSFVFQDGSREVDLLKIYGDIGQNVTNAIGSGFEVSKDGYLFLGCSDPQDGGSGKPWNVFLAYLGKSGSRVELTWLTHSGSTINCARLVKVDSDTFVAMWNQDGNVHYQTLSGQGKTVGQEQVLSGVTMPPTQPVVINGDVCWIQVSSQGTPTLYRISPSA